MKLTGSVVLFSTAIALVYGVIFSSVYPRVTIDGSIVALIVLLAVLTCLALVGLWRLVRRS